MIGDSVEGCFVRWKGGGYGPGAPHAQVDRHGKAHGSNGLWHELRSVNVRHVGRNTVEWTRPRSGAVVRKRLTGQHLQIAAPGGRDLVAEWRESE